MIANENGEEKRVAGSLTGRTSQIVIRETAHMGHVGVAQPPNIVLTDGRSSIGLF